MSDTSTSPLSALEARLSTWSARPQIKRALIWAQRLLTGLVVAYLLWKLSEIGWADVLASIPLSPWFYALFAVMFLALPASEVVIYNRVWGVSHWSSFGTYLIKRVLNFGVLAYSGEAYFFSWAKPRAELAGKVVMSAVKDVNILSGLSSNTCTVVMLALFFAVGPREVLDASGVSLTGPVVVFVLVSLILVAVVMRFHRHVLALSRSDAIWVAALHTLRLLGIMVLQAAQWAVALPMVGFGTWFFFLTMQLVVTRIPFLPNKELVFMGASLALLPAVDAPAAAVAAMFLVSGALSQVANVGLVLGLGGAKLLRGQSKVAAS